MNNTFFIEIGTEELPSKELRSLAENFAKCISVQFNKEKIFYEFINWYATSCRLAVKINQINNINKNLNIKNNNFNVKQFLNYKNKSTKIVQMLTKKNIISAFKTNKLEVNKNKKVLNKYISKQKSINILLFNIVSKAIKKLHLSQNMYWGNKNIKFIRPVNNITCLLNNKLILFNLFKISSNRMLNGNIFTEKKKIQLDHVDYYPKILLKHGNVIADYYQRKNLIFKNITKIAKTIKGLVDIDNNLLEEINSLVEWPKVLIGNFEKKYLFLPKEILIHIMKNNYKYFPVFNNKKKLLPYFIFVVNTKSKNLKKIIKDNEKIISLNFKEIEFFFNLDRKQKLENNLMKLSQVLFQNQLGNLKDKSYRISSLSAWIANKINLDTKQALRAGLLSKCDLITNMVQIFPETKGIIGMYYAIYDHEHKNVALALKEQYYSNTCKDDLPTTMLSCSVSIADKIDSLVGIFSINSSPIKNSKDPFSIRRTVFGILNIILEKKISINLKDLVQESIKLYHKNEDKLLLNNIINFFLKRLYFLYQKKGYKINIIKSILIKNNININCIYNKLIAINNFLLIKKSSILILTNKRINKIIFKYNFNLERNIDQSLAKNLIEIKLINNFLELEKKVKLILKNKEYKYYLISILNFCELISDFFVNIKIITDDNLLNLNRLTILSKIYKSFNLIADISFWE